MLRKKFVCVSILGLSVLLTLGGGTRAEESKNIVKNPSCEDVDSAGHPIGWGLYGPEGKPIWGTSTEEFHSGARSAFLTTQIYETVKAERPDLKFVNSGLVVGESDGYGGNKAYNALPNTDYYFSFWIKSDVDEVVIDVIGWKTLEAASKDRKRLDTSIEGVIGRVIQPTSKWKKYEGVFTTSETKKFVVEFAIFGREDRGKKLLGTIYVDDVVIYPLT